MTRTIARITALVVCAALPAAVARAQERANPHQQLGGRQCTECHTTSDWSDVRFDHGRTGFPLAGLHQTAPCTGCHDLRDFRGASTECRSCHLDPHRGDAGTGCEQCHTPSGWNLVRAQDAHARTRLPDLGVHASLRCEDCHRRTGVQPFTAAVAPCVACHQTTYANTTNPAHTAIGFSTQCADCHQLSTWSFALFAQHDAIFGIYRGAHAGSWRSCATCHTTPGNYQAFTCTTCHANGPTTSAHDGVPGYTWESTACLGCHPGGRGGGDLSFHDAIFPVFSGTHAGQWTSCSQCHTDPANRKAISCLTAGCHVQSTSDRSHLGITGYAYTTPDCRSCHPDGRAGTFTNHDVVFPVYSGTHLNKWTTCSDCHTNPSNRAIFSCVNGGCHPSAQTNGNHAGIPGYAYQSAQCLSCHPDGRTGTFAQHDAVFPVYTGAHAGKWTGCEQCHITPGNRPDVSCLTAGCHAQPASNTFHLSMAGYSYATTQCRACHPDGSRGRYTAHDPRFPIYSGKHAGRWDACATCHNDPASRAAFTCMNGACHPAAETNGHHSGIPGYGYTAPQCYSCHTQGVAGTFLQHDAIFAVYTGPHGGTWTQCEQCHITPGVRADVSCLTAGCHVRTTTDYTHRGIPGYGYQSSQCLTCHPAGQIGTFTQHDVLFPIWSGAHAAQWASCATCHIVAGDRSVFTCMSAACHPQASTNSHHAEVAGYQYVATACYTCHPRGTSD